MFACQGRPLWTGLPLTHLPSFSELTLTGGCPKPLLPRGRPAQQLPSPPVVVHGHSCSFMRKDETHTVLLERRFWRLSVGVLHPRRHSRYVCRATAWAERCLSSQKRSVQPKALTSAIQVLSHLKHEICVINERIRFTRNATVSSLFQAVGSLVGFLSVQPYSSPYSNHFEFHLDGNLSNICLKSHAEVVIATVKCNSVRAHVAARFRQPPRLRSKESQKRCHPREGWKGGRLSRWPC